MKITCERVGGIALIRIDNPPINALETVVRAGLADALDRSKDARLVIISGRENLFCGGSDLRSFGDAERESPTITDIVERLVRYPTATLACVEGAVIGGGFELALACQYRVASPSARFSFPEVNLGLLPGTQLLPRWIEIEPALEMLLTGRRIDAETALSLKLVASIADDPVRHVQDTLDEWPFSEHPANRPVTPFLERQSIVDLSRAFSVSRGEVAPALIVKLVALGRHRPFAEVLAREDQYRQELVNGTIFPALRHLFFAEGLWRKTPDENRDRIIIDRLKSCLQNIAPNVRPEMVHSPSNAETVRIMKALADEGRNLISEHEEIRDTDIDYLVISRLGFPRLTGGPFYFSEKLAPPG